MHPTSIKLPPGLQERVAAAAEAEGQSPHAFMIRAIEQQTALAEVRRGFVEDALAAREAMERTGVGYAAAEVHAYLKARARGSEGSRRPDPRSWRG